MSRTTITRSQAGSAMRFERYLAHPIEKVWAALTESGRLAEWFAPGIIDLVPGGRVSIVFSDTDAIESTVTEIDPPYLLEYRWIEAPGTTTAINGDSGPVRWELSEEDGGTRLILTHTHPGSDEDVIEDRSGWETHLSMLVDALAGRPRTFDWDQHNALVAKYRAETGIAQKARDEPMPNTSAHQIFKERGMQTIATEQPTGALIPFDFNGVVFRQMFEYAVVEFKTEVGFFSEVFGFNSIAMGPDSALFTTPTSDSHFSIRRAGEQHDAANLQGIKLLFMTADFASAEARIRESGLVDDAAVGKGSPSQRVVSLASPAGLPIEIWEDPFPQREA